MEEFVPSTIPWLSEDSRYHDGVEIGALLTVFRMSNPVLLKAKIRAGNEDQLRVLSPGLGYHFNVDARDEEWAYITMTSRVSVEEMDEDDPGDG